VGLSEASSGEVRLSLSRAYAEQTLGHDRGGVVRHCARWSPDRWWTTADADL